MRNVKLVIEFDGTRYHGSQKQAEDKEPTVQGVMEKCLARLLGEETPLIFSGRTDSGVHALGQVVNFKTANPIPVERIPIAYSNLLPGDIRVISAEEVPLDFHARFSARGKTYQYLILQGRSVFWQHKAWQLEERLNLEAMRQAAALLVGEHDFSSWRAQGCTASSPVRNLWELSVEPRQIGPFELIAITASSTGFLYKMVRNLVATLVAVGQGKLTAKDVEVLLDKRDRNLAPPTAPACGLYLVKVDY